MTHDRELIEEAKRRLGKDNAVAVFTLYYGSCADGSEEVACFERNGYLDDDFAEWLQVQLGKGNAAYKYRQEF